MWQERCKYFNRIIQPTYTCLFPNIYVNKRYFEIHVLYRKVRKQERMFKWDSKWNLYGKRKWQSKPTIFIVWILNTSRSFSKICLQINLLLLFLAHIAKRHFNFNDIHNVPVPHFPDCLAWMCGRFLYVRTLAARTTEQVA